jgi:tripartite-type tricarboxylate transporter receptor subunit TctC
MGLTSLLKRTTKIIASVALAVSFTADAAPWQPTKNVEFVVPAGTGGGADQMARLIQGIITTLALVILFGPMISTLVKRMKAR